MKKLVSIVLAVLTATPIFCACSTNSQPATALEQPATIEQPNVATRETIPTPEPEKPPATERKNVEIILDGGFNFLRTPIYGTRRHFRNIAGEYSVEYVHVPFGVDNDDTLSYDIALNPDNTYSMTVISGGVTSNHQGRWYENYGGITFYFDERIDPPAHNEYIADNLFAELLPHSKLMIYDSGRTIVLSRREAIEQPNNAQDDPQESVQDNIRRLYLDGSTTERKLVI